MSVKQATVLQCDFCLVTHQALWPMPWKADDVRKAADDHGWTTKTGRHKVRDFCPECSGTQDAGEAEGER